MSYKHSKGFLLLSLISIILITLAVVRFSAVQQLKVSYRVSAYGVPANQSTGVGAVSFKHYQLPYSFEVGRVSSLTMHDILLHTTVMPGMVLFGFESTEAVDCWVVLDDEPCWGSDTSDDVLVYISDCYEFYDVLEIKQRSVISFCFKTDTDTLSEVTLIGVKDPQFTRHTESSSEVNEAVDTARTFLELNGVDVGRYLSHTVEQGEPNYYWQKEFHYPNLANLVYHNPTEPCENIAIRFEQQNRPGHYYEVWVNPDTFQIIGGDECR